MKYKPRHIKQHVIPLTTGKLHISKLCLNSPLSQIVARITHVLLLGTRIFCSTLLCKILNLGNMHGGTSVLSTQSSLQQHYFFKNTQHVATRNYLLSFPFRPCCTCWFLRLLEVIVPCNIVTCAII